MARTIYTEETDGGLYIREQLDNGKAIKAFDEMIDEHITSINERGLVQGSLIAPIGDTVIRIPEDEQEKVIAALYLRRRNS